MIKILVVEDDLDNNGFVTTYLKGNGYQVESCFDGEQALALIK